MSKLDKFIDSIDHDISWRKKEASNIILMHDHNNSEIIVKSSVLFIYSHWEGCIKNLCLLYLRYVSSLSIELSQLTNNYKALALKGIIKQLLNSSNSLTIINELAIIESLDNSADKRFNINVSLTQSEKDKPIINTENNLNYKTFILFLKIVGIKEKNCLSTKKTYIDIKLVHNRNKIAHGNKVSSYDDDFDLDIESITAIKCLVFSIIDSLAEDLKCFAKNKYYLASKESESEKYSECSNDKLKHVLDGLAL